MKLPTHSWEETTERRPPASVHRWKERAYGHYGGRFAEVTRTAAGARVTETLGEEY